MPPLQPPPTLKSVSHYQRLSTEHATRDPVVAYWALFHTVQRSLSLDKSSPDAKLFIVQLLDELEQKKKALSTNEAVTNETVAQAHIENYIDKLFKYADNADRRGEFNKNTIKAFYTSSLLVDVLENFGEISEEFDRMRKYGKWKAAYVHNCLKRGETPVAGPVGDEMGTFGEQDYETTATNDAGGFSGSSEPSNQQASSQPYPNYPSSYPPNQPTTMIHHSEPEPRGQTQTLSGVQLTIQQLTQAQKYTKFASSALTFDDVPTAIENLKKALLLLETGVDS